VLCDQLQVHDVGRNTAQVVRGPARYGGFCKRCSAGGERQRDEREALGLWIALSMC